MNKSTLLTIILSCFLYSYSVGQFSFGQPKDSSSYEVRIEPDFFLLGAFSDYLGRFQYINRERQIDRYYPYEEPIAHYVSNFINRYYHIQPELTFTDSRQAEIYSSELAGELHSKYFTKEGKFIDEQLDSEAKKYSFLLGAYYRYGEQLDGNIFQIQVQNSHKSKQLYAILKELESDKILYKFLRGYRPSSSIFYFVATPRMIKYFKTIEVEKEALRISYQEKLVKKLLEGPNVKLYKNQTAADKKALLKSLKSVFDMP